MENPNIINIIDTKRTELEEAEKYQDTYFKVKYLKKMKIPQQMWKNVGVVQAVSRKKGEIKINKN